LADRLRYKQLNSRISSVQPELFRYWKESDRRWARNNFKNIW
jgi:hypothetical protein